MGVFRFFVVIFLVWSPALYAKEPDDFARLDDLLGCGNAFNLRSARNEGLRQALLDARLNPELVNAILRYGESGIGTDPEATAEWLSDLVVRHNFFAHQNPMSPFWHDIPRVDLVEIAGDLVSASLLVMQNTLPGGKFYPRIKDQLFDRDLATNVRKWILYPAELLLTFDSNPQSESLPLIVNLLIEYNKRVMALQGLASPFRKSPRRQTQMEIRLSQDERVRRAPTNWDHLDGLLKGAQKIEDVLNILEKNLGPQGLVQLWEDRFYLLNLAKGWEKKFSSGTPVDWGQLILTYFVSRIVPTTSVDTLAHMISLCVDLRDVRVAALIIEEGIRLKVIQDDRDFDRLLNEYRIKFGPLLKSMKFDSRFRLSFDEADSALYRFWLDSQEVDGSHFSASEILMERLMRLRGVEVSLARLVQEVSLYWNQVNKDRGIETNNESYLTLALYQTLDFPTKLDFSSIFKSIGVFKSPSSVEDAQMWLIRAVATAKTKPYAEQLEALVDEYDIHFRALTESPSEIHDISNRVETLRAAFGLLLKPPQSRH